MLKIEKVRFSSLWNKLRMIKILKLNKKKNFINVLEKLQNSKICYTIMTDSQTITFEDCWVSL